MYVESELDSQYTASAIGQCFTSRDVTWLWAQNLYSQQPNEKMPLVYR
jgi:hypothetical protein